MSSLSRHDGYLFKRTQIPACMTVSTLACGVTNRSVRPCSLKFKTCSDPKGTAELQLTESVRKDIRDSRPDG